MRDRLAELLVAPDTSIKEALRRMSAGGEKILFVADDQQRLIAVLSDGNVRRFILNTGGISGTVRDCCNFNPIFIHENYDRETLKKLLLKEKIEVIPIIDTEKRVTGVLRWCDLFGEEKNKYTPIHCAVVIMAGGLGSRLDPFTRILPKPLIPINDKSVIDIIMENLAQHDVTRFHLSINHKARVLKAYLEEKEANYEINYIEEEVPLGTAGSLKFLEGQVSTDILVTNCDVIFDVDYSEILKFHINKSNDITIVGALHHFTVPYGVCSIGNGGQLVGLEEKPEYDFLVNTGMYIIRPEMLSLIPSDTFFNFTDLIEKAKGRNCNVSVFPIDDKAWIDVGQWEEYRKAVNAFRNKL